jgi:hypothetical protein
MPLSQHEPPVPGDQAGFAEGGIVSLVAITPGQLGRLETTSRFRLQDLGVVN